MNNAWLAGIPLFIFILGTLISKKIEAAALVSSVLAVVMLEKANFLPGYIAKMYEVCADSSFQLLVIVSLCFAGMAELLERSGAMFGFRRFLERVCRTEKKTAFFTWLLGGVIFIDDYLNALAVSASMKSISDEKRIPREHLAYTTNCMGACVCVLIPVSSWAAFAIGCGVEQGAGLKDYLEAIPMMFYPICAIIICLLVGLKIFPPIGMLKKAYRRVEQGGAVLDEKDARIEEINADDLKAASPVNFLIPVAVLVGGMLYFDNNIIAGVLLALAAMFIMYLVQRVFTPDSFIRTFVKGAGNVLPLVINIFVVYIMEKAVSEMGFIDYLTGLLSRMFPRAVLPMVAFLSVAAICFFAASFWALIAIAFPLFLPMAASVGLPAAVIIAAVMSGVALGSQACLYSDAIFMVAAGTGVSNTRQFEVVLPYTIIGAVAAALLFLAVGFLV